MNKQWDEHKKSLYVFYKAGESNADYFNTPFQKYVDVYAKCLIDNYGELVTVENIDKLLHCSIKVKLSDDANELGVCHDNHKVKSVKELCINNSVFVYVDKPNRFDMADAIEKHFDIQEQFIKGEINTWGEKIEHDDDVYFDEQYLCTLFHELTHVTCLDQDTIKIRGDYKTAENFDEEYLKKRKIFRFQNGSLACIFRVNDELVHERIVYGASLNLQEGMTELMTKRMCLSKMFRESMKELGLPHIPYYIDTYVPLVAWTKIACKIYPEYYDLYFKGIESKFFNSSAEKKFTRKWFKYFDIMENFNENFYLIPIKLRAGRYIAIMSVGADILNKSAKERLKNGEISLDKYETIKKALKQFLQYDKDIFELNDVFDSEKELRIRNKLMEKSNSLDSGKINKYVEKELE